MKLEEREQKSQRRGKMDKAIKKLKTKIDKGMDRLVKEDKPRDKKLKECGKVMKKKKR